MAPVMQIVFSHPSSRPEAVAAIRDTSLPLMWLLGESDSLTSPYCTRSLMAEDVEVTALKWNGRVVGAYGSNANADYCWLAGIAPDDTAASRSAQTRIAFETLDHVLAQVGMNIRHVVRTWWYLDHMLDWYGEFNTVRNAYFQETGVWSALVPASTGIGLANPYGAALVAGAVAIRPKHPGVTITAVDSPLQCPATNYRSSFSRAVEIGTPDSRHLMISGTASIAPDGTSAHLDDVLAQIRLTMEVVEAILKSRAMNWSNTVRAIAYFRHSKDLSLLEPYCQERGITDLPVTLVQATVCRDDLLFELELDAVAQRWGGRASS